MTLVNASHQVTPSLHELEREVPACFNELASAETRILNGVGTPDNLLPSIKAVLETTDEELNEDSLSYLAHLHYTTLRYVNDYPLEADDVVSAVVKDPSLLKDILPQYEKFLAYVSQFSTNSSLCISSLKNAQVSFGRVDSEGFVLSDTSMNMEMLKSALALYTHMHGKEFFKDKPASLKLEYKPLQLVFEISILLALVALASNLIKGDDGTKVVDQSTRTPTPRSQPSQIIVTPTLNTFQDDSFLIPSPVPSGPSPEPPTLEQINNLSDGDIIKFVPYVIEDDETREVSTIRRNLVLTMSESGYSIYDVIQQREVDIYEAGIILVRNESGNYVEFPLHSTIEEMVLSMEGNGINGSVVKKSQTDSTEGNVFNELLSHLEGTQGQSKFVFTFQADENFKIISDFACWGVDIEGQLFSIVVYLDANGSYRVEVVAVEPSLIDEKY